MKLIDLFEQHPELTPKQVRWLNAVSDWEYKNGVVNVEGDVDAEGEGLTKIPVQFGYVSGNFYIHSNSLTSLQGSPREVGGNFKAYNNELTTLEGSPREVGGNFVVSHNNLTSLKGAPKEVGDFYAEYNKFKSEPDHSFIKIHGKFVWKEE